MAHLEVLKLYDYILGYTCISKTKVNQIKEIENSGYTRKQLYECLKANADEIKRYLDEKGIYEEYGKLCYITSALKNKIHDFSNSLNNTIASCNNECNISDCLDETDEDIINRLNKANERKTESIMDIIRKVKGDKNGR